MSFSGLFLENNNWYGVNWQLIQYNSCQHFNNKINNSNFQLISLPLSTYFIKIGSFLKLCVRCNFFKKNEKKDRWRRRVDNFRLFVSRIRSDDSSYFCALHIWHATKTHRVDFTNILARIFCTNKAKRN
jgi:hypothetical protein